MVINNNLIKRFDTYREGIQNAIGKIITIFHIITNFYFCLGNFFQFLIKAKTTLSKSPLKMIHSVHDF